MRILFIVTGLKIGGAEIQVSSLAKQMLRLRHQVAIVVLNDGIEVTLPNEVTIFSLGMSKTPISFVQALRSFQEIVKTWQPDVVHSHMVHANLFSRLARLLNVPIKRLICTAHSTNEGRMLRMILYRLTDRWTDLTTNVSNAGVRAFVKIGAVPQHRIKCVYDGVDADKFHADQSKRENTRSALNIDNTFCFLAVGRLTREKGYINLINAFEKIHQQRSDMLMLIAGEGPDRLLIEQTIDALGISSCVKLLGNRQDVVDLLNACDCFVMAPLWEGFGIAIVEAMMCEKVVIASNVGGIPEVLGDRGILVPSGDIGMLANAMKDVTLLSNEQCQLLGREARGRAYNLFGLSEIANQWVKIYNANYH